MISEPFYPTWATRKPAVLSRGPANSLSQFCGGRRRLRQLLRRQTFFQLRSGASQQYLWPGAIMAL